MDLGPYVAAAVAVAGWITVHLLTRARDVRSRRDERRLQHLEKQIEDLYGPLVGLIRQTLVVYEIAVAALGRDGKLHVSDFSAQELTAWRFLQERYFFPLNAEIVKLLKERGYLAGEDIPASFNDFLLHATQFECLHLLWKETGFDSSPRVKGRGWPEKFWPDVDSRFQRTLATYAHTVRLLSLEPR